MVYKDGDFNPVHVKSEGERYPTDTVYCKTAESEEGGRVWHPTQKPVALGRYLIRMFTKKGDVVLDNAFGSGSFLVAAALEERKFIGIEKNEEVHLFKKQPVNYIDVAKLRLDEVKQYRSILIEAVAEYDENLLDKYMEDENSITEEEINNALRAATIDMAIIPMIAGSSFKNKGVQLLTTNSTLKFLRKLLIQKKNVRYFMITNVYVSMKK